MGYWYNGYYSGLLIRQIRVRIPGSPLTPHLLNGQVTRPSIWKYGFKSRWGDYFGQLAERERRPIEARKKVRSTRTLSTHVRTVWDQSGLQILTWMVRVLLFPLRSFTAPIMLLWRNWKRS